MTPYRERTENTCSIGAAPSGDLPKRKPKKIALDKNHRDPLPILDDAHTLVNFSKSRDTATPVFFSFLFLFTSRLGRDLDRSVPFRCDRHVSPGTAVRVAVTARSGAEKRKTVGQQFLRRSESNPRRTAAFR